MIRCSDVGVGRRFLDRGDHDGHSFVDVRFCRRVSYVLNYTIDLACRWPDVESYRLSVGVFRQCE